ncbi:MAG: hypothetical protein WC812_02150 [Candidatus Pacearchaeota archaeon]|jgi:hypothetical protein
MVKTLEKPIFGEEFNESFKQFTIIGIHDTLESQPQLKELPYIMGKNNEAHIKELCNLFKERYDKELKYSFRKGICYFSYA